MATYPEKTKAQEEASDEVEAAGVSDRDKSYFQSSLRTKRHLARAATEDPEFQKKRRNKSMSDQMRAVARRILGLPEAQADALEK